MLKYFPVILLLGCLGQSCNVKNPKEPTPTYIHVDSFTFTNNKNITGLSLSHQIAAVTAYYNNNPVGTFDLPATFPVITNGTGKLSLYPVILLDGFNNFLAPYPFYAPDTFTFSEQPGVIINRIPKTHYFDSTKHYLNCNFDLASIYFSPINSTVPILTSFDKPDIFEGNGAGKISLSLPNDTLSECISFSTFNIPAGVDAFIELNYKCTVPFYLGLKSSLNNSTTYYQRYLSGVYPSDHWQKFYLSIKDFAAQYTGDYYTLYIKAVLPAGTASGTVLLDNIQFVYF